MKGNNNKTLEMAFTCHRHWDEMPDADRGKYCSECHKNILDLTTLDDSQILELIRRNGQVCGRIREDQLHRTLHVPATHGVPVWKRWFLGMGALTMGFAPLHIFSRSKHPIEIASKRHPLIPPLQITGSLRILQAGKSLMGIRVESNGISAFTDANGKFTLNLEEPAEGQPISLEITRPDLIPVEYVIQYGDRFDPVMVNLDAKTEISGNLTTVKGAKPLLNQEHVYDFRVYTPSGKQRAGETWEIFVYSKDTLLAQARPDSFGTCVFGLPASGTRSGQLEIRAVARKNGNEVDSTERYLQPGLNPAWNISLITATRRDVVSMVGVVISQVNGRVRSEINLLDNTKQYKNPIDKPVIRD